MEVEGVIESELGHQAAGGEQLIQAEVALAQKSAEAAEELAQTKGEVVEY